MVIRNSIFRKSVFMMIIALLFYPYLAFSKDLGVYGQAFNIKEIDLLEQIENKLKYLESTGKIAEHQNAISKKAKESIERPNEVTGIIDTDQERVFYYDPSIILDEDLTDDKGEVFYKKNTLINPLDYVPFTKTMVFFNGDAKQQAQWALDKHKTTLGNAILVMTKGAPIKQSDEWGITVYFDQMGLITKKLGIRQVPAIVTQEGNRLKIEEVKIEEKP
jgi:conjugal transfer pilus assembly protein TraW